jgi:hypothetical protein
MAAPSNNSLFFPGFFDPDGRPWEEYPGGIPPYVKGISSALKVAMLTQQKLLIPIGYFFDNPALQLLVQQHAGDSDEARSFRLLLNDLLLAVVDSTDVTALGGVGTKLDNEKLWWDLWRSWYVGHSVHPRPPVYLNCVPEKHSRDFEQLYDAEIAQAKLSPILQATYSVDVGGLFGTYAKLNLRTIGQQDFPFDDLLRNRLLSGSEQFFDFKDGVSDKVHAIATSVQSNGKKLSRTLMRSAEACRELGIKDHHILTPDDYKLLYPILQHYHHFAFAKSLALPAFGTQSSPKTVGASTEKLFQEEAARLCRYTFDGAKHLPPTWPLESVKFEEIAKLRLQKSDKFVESLIQIQSAVLATNREPKEVGQVLHDHMRMVTGAISFDFKHLKPSDFDAMELAKGMGDMVTGTKPDPKFVGQVARFAFSAVRDFIPNIRKELQLRWTFRRLIEDDQEDAA